MIEENTKTQETATARTIVYVCGEDGVILSTPDCDLGLGSTLDETDMPHPNGDGVWLWIDRGSIAEPPGLDSMYSEGMIWRGFWRHLTHEELARFAGAAVAPSMFERGSAP